MPVTFVNQLVTPQIGMQVVLDTAEKTKTATPPTTAGFNKPRTTLQWLHILSQINLLYNISVTHN